VWAPPVVSLDWDVDDLVEPETVTIFAERWDTTRWLPADFDHAVSLADAR
jgi:hypothetical protein